jgi:hypothetical protein
MAACSECVGSLASLQVGFLCNETSAMNDRCDVTWLVLLGTVLGTVIGSTGTLLSQHLASRATEKRERLTREAQRREQRREAIEAFLGAAQEVDRVASHHDERPSEVIHQLWLCYHRLAVLSTEQLQRPLKEFADALNTIFWTGAPDGLEVWEHLHNPRERFGLAARVELAENTTQFNQPVD